MQSSCTASAHHHSSTLCHDLKFIQLQLQDRGPARNDSQSPRGCHSWALTRISQLTGNSGILGPVL